jgi:hypothetical protein
MNNPRLLRTVIAVLAVALCISLGLLAWALSDSAAWKVQVRNLAQYEGVTVAREDFQAGRLRLFVIAGRRERDEFSGTNDGPFEVWYSSYFPETRAYCCAAETRVAAYDAKMHFWQQHPERFSGSTNATAQGKAQ